MPEYIEIQPDVTVRRFSDVQAAYAWLRWHIGDPLMDNVRFAYADEPSQISLYLKKQQEGTCKAFDTTVMIGTREAKLGCNYGYND